MTDAAQKIATIEAFAWTAEEVDAVFETLASPDPWADSSPELKHLSPVLRSLKVKLAKLHLTLQTGKCCYCRSLLTGGGPFLIDREHILPKSKYEELSYDPSNLSVSCKRCNLEYKGQSVAFVIDPDTIRDDHQNCLRYHFVHPNFDTWSQHLKRFSVQLDEQDLVAYKVEPGSAKGAYTHKFFNLAGLEVNTFDEAQGQQSISDLQKLLRDRLERRVS